MKKFNVTVNGNAYEVEVEEIGAAAPVAAAPKKSNKGLVILLLIEIAGILGVAGYWLMKFL